MEAETIRNFSEQVTVNSSSCTPNNQGCEINVG